MTAPVLQVDDRPGTRWITLTRPERRNAIDDALAEELGEQFRVLGTDRSVRVVILRGAGRSFCSGIDVKARLAGAEGPDRAGQLLARQGQIAGIVAAMRGCPQPIIALVHGHAVGAGMSLALAADVRVLTPDATLDPAFVRLGLTGGDSGSSWFLPRLVGHAVARSVLLTGRPIDAELAERSGLAMAVVGRDELAATGARIADDMLRCGPHGLAFTKELLDHAEAGTSLAAHLALENRSQVICSLNGDTAEARRARSEGRDPGWYPGDTTREDLP